MRRILAYLGAVALGIGLVMQAALAQPGSRDPDRAGEPPDPRGEVRECTQIADLDMVAYQLPSFRAPGQSVSSLLAIVGVPVPIEGSNSRLRILKPDGCTARSTTSALPHFTWRLEKPPGSKAVLEDTTSLKVTFKPDLPGDYVAHLVGCPNDATSKKKCTLRLVTSYTSTGKPVTEMVQLGPTDKAVKVTVAAGGQLPPIYAPGNFNDPGQPLTATSPQHYGASRDFCGNVDLGIGVLRHPEWYTTQHWTTPLPPYELAEGRVYRSNIAGHDATFSHVDNDHNARMELDPPYRRLLVDDAPEDKGQLLPYGGLEVEWEFLDYPDAFRPIEGDRMSVLGYHVADCGHDDHHTEIHPPIAIAVHRPRAVKLPEKFQYATDPKSGKPVGPPQPIGSNVYVPGIVTDIWVNLNGGEVLNSGSSDLHQPVMIVGSDGLEFPASVTQPMTKGETFQFTVYLPPSPTYLLGMVMSPPFDPALFVQIQDHPRAADLGAATPLMITEVERQLKGPWPYVRYSIDLSTLNTGDRFAKRIVAAWVYPDLAGQNFGLHAYRVRLEQMKVSNTGDVFSGDWKLWATLPSVDAPWTKLIECRSCIDTKSYVPGATIWEHGAMDGVGHLMGEVLVFQPTDIHLSQSALLRFTGYDDDWESSDPIGDVVARTDQLGRFNTGTVCDPNDLSNTDCPGFDLVYSVERGATPVTESLAPAAKTAFQALLIHPAAAAKLVRPAENELYSSSMTARRKQILLQRQEDDTIELKKFLEPANLRSNLQKWSAAQWEGIIKDVRKRTLHFLGPNPSTKHRQKVAADLQKLKGSIPAALYKKYLCDLETGTPCP